MKNECQLKTKRHKMLKRITFTSFFFLETTLLFLKANLYVKFKDTRTKMIIAFVNN